MQDYEIGYENKLPSFSVLHNEMKKITGLNIKCEISDNRDTLKRARELNIIKNIPSDITFSAKFSYPKFCSVSCVRYLADNKIIVIPSINNIYYLLEVLIYILRQQEGAIEYEEHKFEQPEWASMKWSDKKWWQRIPR